MLTSLTVKLGAPKARFSAAVEQRSGKIRVAGIVRDGKPFLSEIGDFDVDVTLEVSVQPDAGQVHWQSLQHVSKSGGEAYFLVILILICDFLAVVQWAPVRSSCYLRLV